MAPAKPIFEGFTNACQISVLNILDRCACHTNISDILMALH